MKDVIRKQVLAVRNKLTEEEATALSRDVFNNLKKNAFFNSSRNVMVYLDFKREVKTDDIIEYCLANGKQVYVPICIPETHELCISRLLGLDMLQKGHFGIREPYPEHIRLSDSSLLDLILVPGVAFDAAGNRIGFGAGYYDRFMKRLRPDTVKTALAYSFQVVEKVPSDEYDIPADYIVTEKDTLVCSNNTTGR